MANARDKPFFLARSFITGQICIAVLTVEPFNAVFSLAFPKG
jgi:hypothetical protein